MFKPVVAGEKAGFYANVEAVDLGNLVMASTEMSGQQFHRDCALARKDQADHVMLQLYTAGGYTGSNGNQEMTVEAGDISVLDLAHDVHTQAKTSHNLTVIIPRDLWLAQCGGGSFAVGVNLKRQYSHWKASWRAYKNGLGRHTTSTTT